MRAFVRPVYWGTEPIQYATGMCWLGAYLGAVSARGLCALFLGDDSQPLERILQAQFAHAVRAGAGQAEFLREAIAPVFAVPGARPGLPLDMRGTDFQRRVWQQLLQTRPGEHITYAVLAGAAAAPGQARAAGGACAANLLSVVVPCHRAVGTSGGLAGYRWGLARKQALLDWEAQAASGSL